jgi:predicted transcriptional regulator of viral defense system
MELDPVSIFKENGGQLRMSEAVERGVSRYTLYLLRDKGIIEPINRGVYRLVELPPVSNPDLIAVALRYPNAVVCLISALSFHGITTQIPHEISLAIPRDARSPSADYPPLEVHQFTEEAYKAGIEAHSIDGAKVKIYSPEKTLADCFKFRNKIGMDVVLEALKLYRTRMQFDHKKLLQYARICRVEKIMRPYLEASL